MSTVDTYIRARIDTDTKERATEALEAMGLTASDAIRLLMLRVANERRLPFEIKAPNAVTHQAITRQAEKSDEIFKSIAPLSENLLCVAGDPPPTQKENTLRNTEKSTSAIDRSKSLRTRVTQRLRRAIIDGEFSLGQALSEEKLATALGVGRTPVRDALTSLQHQGLIDVQPQRGSFVFLPSGADVAKLCEFREMMELQALSLCYLRCKETALAQMRKICEDMKTAERRKDFLALTQADGRFHNTLFENCKNQYLIDAYNLASGQVAALRARTTVVAGMAEEHYPIIEAMANDDLPRARQILSKHVLKVRGLYASAIQSQGLTIGSKQDYSDPLAQMNLYDDQ